MDARSSILCYHLVATNGGSSIPMKAFIANVVIPSALVAAMLPVVGYAIEIKTPTVSMPHIVVPHVNTPSVSTQVTPQVKLHVIAPEVTNGKKTANTKAANTNGAQTNSVAGTPGTGSAGLAHVDTGGGATAGASSGRVTSTVPPGTGTASQSNSSAIPWSHDDQSPKETITFEYGGLVLSNPKVSGRRPPSVVFLRPDYKSSNQGLSNLPALPWTLVLTTN